MYNPYQSQMMNPNQQYSQFNQPNYIPMIYVNGIEGAKAYIVAPNQKVYLKDSDSNLLYEKSADAVGKFSLKAYEMKEIEQSPSKEMEFATKSDFIEFKDHFNERLDSLSAMIEKLGKTKKTGVSSE